MVGAHLALLGRRHRGHGEDLFYLTASIVKIVILLVVLVYMVGAEIYRHRDLECELTATQCRWNLWCSSNYWRIIHKNNGCDSGAGK